MNIINSLNIFFFAIRIDQLAVVLIFNSHIPAMSTRNKSRNLYADEPFLDNINLITGAKITSSRATITDQQIRNLCVDQTTTNLQKFKHIHAQGDKLQLWAVFQSLHIYIRSSSDAEVIFQLLLKQFKETLSDHLYILSEGVQKFIQTHDFILKKQVIDRIFQLIFTIIVSENSKLTQEWISTLKTYYDRFKNHYEQCVQYINGSLTMRASPQRRKICFMMIDVLSHHFPSVLEKAQQKILFFFQDHDPQTRNIISKIAFKLLTLNPKNEEIWKIIWQYYNDKEKSVKQEAFKVLCSIYRKQNFQSLLYQLDNSLSLSAFYFKDLLKTFSEQIKNSGKTNFIISFLNRVLKTENIKLIQQAFSGFSIICSIIREQVLQNDVQFEYLNIAKQDNLSIIVQIYHQTDQKQTPNIRQKMKSLTLKGIRLAKYLPPSNNKQLIDMLNLNQEKQALLFIKICLKLLQESHWHQLQQNINSIIRIKVNYILFQQIQFFVSKMLLNCPYHILDSVFSLVKHLALVNRKSSEIFANLRQKLFKSKSWAHRRNYILLYFYLKKSTSLELQRSIPVFSYKSLTIQNVGGVKLQFIRQVQQTYQFIDFIPHDKKQKQRQMITQTLIYFVQNDKDFLVKQQAKLALKQIKRIQSLIDINKLNRRNIDLSTTEDSYQEMSFDRRSSIITDKQIRISVLKKRSENAKLLSTTKPLLVSLCSNIYSKLPTQRKSKELRATSNQLSRCNSMKNKLPVLTTRNNRAKI